MPIPTDFISKKAEGKTFELFPKGEYVLELKDIELKDSKYKDEETGEVKKQYTFVFNVAGGSRIYWQNFVPTELYVSKKSGKNQLFLIVEALLGRQITQREMMEGLTGEFLNALIGKQCKAYISIIDKDGKQYNKVVDWSPVATAEQVQSFAKSVGAEIVDDLDVSQIPF